MQNNQNLIVMKNFEKYITPMSHDELMQACRRIKHVALDMDGHNIPRLKIIPVYKGFLKNA